MKSVVGSPGTWSGMALRLSQSVFAAASTFSMVSGFGYSNYSAYFYMLLALILQLMWSLNHACKDIFALRNKKDLHTRDNLLFIVMVDWGILAAGLPAVRSYGRPGVHPVVAASCIFFLRVLAIGFIFLGPPSILAAAVVW